MTRDEARAKCIEAIADALYITPEEATAAFDALATVPVTVNLTEATEEMIDAGEQIDQEAVCPANIFSLMSSAGNLLNPPEPK